MASGKPVAEQAATWKFIDWVTNYNAQLNMFNAVGDIPSNAVLASSSQVTSNPLAAGFIAQAALSVPAVNTPEMAVVYTDIGTPLGSAQPTSSTSTITQAQIQADLNTAEADCLRDIAALG